MDKETEVLTKLREWVTETLEELPYKIDPCKMCKNFSEEKGYEAICATCCWFYDSKFEIKGGNE